ncbi:MAG: sigma-70 family RNA polymerase sigma factor, partial [Deltaproteobacteria bacterium]|nr:sigma-70 family RNA polymerase sigma factor [Deltaproteobacteria bacterium]
MQSSASLDRYIQQVRAIPKLSREEEHKLALRAREGDQDAADRLVEANMRYVVAIGLQYRRYGVTLGDLIAEGSVGLVTAVRKFDPHRGTRFVTYAGYWIRAFVLEAVVRSSTMIGAGSGPFRSKLFFRLRRERARLSNLIADPEELVASYYAGSTSVKFLSMPRPTTTRMRRWSKCFRAAQSHRMWSSPDGGARAASSCGSKVRCRSSMIASASSSR